MQCLRSTPRRIQALHRFTTFNRGGQQRQSHVNPRHMLCGSTRKFPVNKRRMLSAAARKSTAKRARLAVKLVSIEAAALRHVKADEEAEARRLLKVSQTSSDEFVIPGKY